MVPRVPSKPTVPRLTQTHYPKPTTPERSLHAGMDADLILGGKRPKMSRLTRGRHGSATFGFSAIAPLTVLSCTLRTAAMIGFCGMALSTLAVSAKANMIINGNFEAFTGGFSGAASQIDDAGTGGNTELTDRKSTRLNSSH